MDLTVVGCSGSFPGPDSPSSSYLLQHDGFNLLVDFGNGALGALQRYIDVYDIDAVLISHLHVDHFIDLCSLYVALKYRPTGPASPLPVWGPSGLGQRLSAAYGLRPGSGMAEQFELRDLTTSFEVGPFDVRAVRVVHPVEAYAFRIEAGGASLVYSGDTGPTHRLTDLAMGADVALFEASFLDGDNPPDLHLSAAQAAQHAAEAGVGTLVLTHLVPWNDPAQTAAQAKPHFPGPIVLAQAGLCRPIGADSAAR